MVVQGRWLEGWFAVQQRIGRRIWRVLRIVVTFVCHANDQFFVYDRSECYEGHQQDRFPKKVHLTITKTLGSIYSFLYYDNIFT